MSLLNRFLKTISSIHPSGLSESQRRLLAQLDTRKIYVENVRSLLDVSHAEALRILETAVRQGVFVKWVEVMCPDGSVAAAAPREDKLPVTVHCWVEGEEGHLEETDFPTARLRKTTFYKLNEQPDTIPHSRTA